MPDATDMELLREYAASGSEQAFESLAERHVALVYSTALRQIGIAAQAEEITQAVFVILARKASKLRGDTILPAWLYETARLTSISFLRSERRRQHREQEAYMQSTLQESSTDPVWEQVAPMLDQAMAGLGRKDREAVVLRYFKNKSAREIGAAMAMGESAAQKRISRALEKLRTFFARRGVVLTTAIVAGAISTNSVQAAPVGLAKAAVAAAIAKGAAEAGPILILVKGGLKLMAWTKAKMAVVATGVLLLAGTTTVVVTKEFVPVREPAYQGKSLLDWLADIGYQQPQDKKARAAEAIRQMGTRTLPFLINDLTLDPKLRSSRVHYDKPDTRTVDQRSNEATWAFDALGPLGKSAIPGLNRLLEQNPGYVPGALAGIGRDALPSLLVALTNQSLWVRDNTAAYLANAIYSGKISPAEAEPALPVALQNVYDTNANIRWRAAGLLEALRLQPDVSVPALIHGLDDPSYSVAMEFAQALGRFGTNAQSAVPELIKASGSTNDLLRIAAVQALSLIDPESLRRDAFAKALQLMTNSNAAIRMQAIQSIGRIGPDASAAIPQLLLQLQEKDEVIRMIAAQSLGLIGMSPEEVIPALCERLQDPSTGVRVEAVGALGKFGPAARSSVPALLELANSSPNLKGNVEMALSQIEPRSAKRIP